jgi:hypothetical protein
MPGDQAIGFISIDLERLTGRHKDLIVLPCCTSKSPYRPMRGAKFGPDRSYSIEDDPFLAGR